MDDESRKPDWLEQELYYNGVALIICIILAIIGYWLEK